MAGEVALRLLLKGGREVAAGLASVTKETGALGKASAEAAKGTKALSGGLDSVAKQGITATRSSKAYLYALTRVADAEQAAAAAATKAAELRTKAVTALADATAKQAAGDLEGARAAKASADAFNAQAAAARRGVVALNAHTSAARANLRAVSSAATASAAAGGGEVGGRAAAFGGLAKVGGALTKTGLAVGGYLGYQGVKRAGAVETTAASLYTLANVPKSQIAGLQSWAISNSPRLREDPNTILSQMYRIASAAPGHPYTARQLEGLAGGAAGLSVIGGSTVDPSQVARVFGIIKANGGLGTRNPRQIAAIAASTVGSGDMLMNDYINAIGTGGLAVNAARHKINLTQLGGALAQMGDLGVTGSAAGTRLSRAISLLSSPTAAASKIYGTLGISPTMIDQVIRSRGLTAGMGLLRRQMALNLPASMRGQVATRADLMGVGYTRSQAASIRKQGPASMEDLLLTRAFGGARQATPIIALLQGLNRTNAKTAGIHRDAAPAVYQAHLNTARTTPAMQWKNFDLGIQKLETNIGLKLIPKLESMASWVERNGSALETTAKVIGVLAIPAIGAYAASLAMRAVGSVSNFTGALRGQNTELAKTGGIAATQSRGIGRFGSAVYATTAAIGVFGLGRATASHGAGGAMTAGLGGAMTGLMVGMQVGGPWGAAIGGASGLVLGLAGHFGFLSGQTDSATRAFQRQLKQLQTMKAWESQAYQSDRYRVGPQFKQGLTSMLSRDPRLTGTLSAAGVTIPQLMRGLRHGGSISGAQNLLARAENGGLVNYNDYLSAMASLTILQTSFRSTATNLSNLATVAGQTSQWSQYLEQTAQQTLDQITADSTGTPVGGKQPGRGGVGKPKKGLGGLLDPTGGAGTHSRSHASGDLHVHVHANGKEIGHAVVQNFRDQQARL